MDTSLRRAEREIMKDEDQLMGPATRQLRREVDGTLDALEAVAEAGGLDMQMLAVFRELIQLTVTLAGHIDTLRVQMGGDPAVDVEVVSIAPLRLIQHDRDETSES